MRGVRFHGSCSGGGGARAVVPRMSFFIGKHWLLENGMRWRMSFDALGRGLPHGRTLWPTSEFGRGSLVTGKGVPSSDQRGTLPPTRQAGLGGDLDENEHGVR